MEWRIVGARPSTTQVAIAAVAAIAVAATIVRVCAQSPEAPAPVTPTTVTPGRPQAVTITVPASRIMPTDPKRLTVSVGMARVDVQRISGHDVTFQSPAFASGLGERKVSVWQAETELATGTLQYRFASDDQLQLGIFIVFVLATLPMAMLWYDIHKAYQFAASTRTAIIDRTSRDGLTLDELRLVIAELGQAPPGVPGLARTMMAFMLMLVVAGTMFYVLSSGAGEVPPVIDKTMTVITTALTTVIAFYFGARTAATAANAATSQALTSVPVSPPPVTPPAAQTGMVGGFAPATGPAGTVISIAGRGFGAAVGRVSFGAVQASPSSWSDALIVTPVPVGLIAGQPVVVEIVPQGAIKPITSATPFIPT